jgi:hypothetical protein
MRSATSIFNWISIRTRKDSLFLMLSLAAILAFGSAAQSAAQARLDGPPRPAMNLPMFRQALPGLLMRLRFVADSGSGRQVQLWDLLVG